MRRRTTRRRLLIAPAGALAAMRAPASVAQTFPARAITLVVPFAASAAPDAVVRALAHEITKEVGKPVVVDNKPGASAIIAAQAVAKAVPDGHTLMPRDRWPVEPLFPLGVLSPMLGAATAILEIVTANPPKRRTIGWNYANQAESQTFVGQVGEAALEIDSAWLHIRRAVSAIDETAQTRRLTGFEKARIQADCAYAMRQLRRAGERLMDIAGPAAFATGSPLQRLWRDLSVGSRHTALNAMLSSELYGRALLGQPSNLMLLPDIRAAA